MTWASEKNVLRNISKNENSPSVSLLANPPSPPPEFPPRRLPPSDQNGDPDLSGILAFFIPAHTNDRIAAQDGLFSVYICEHSEDEIVMDHSAYLRNV